MIGLLGYNTVFMIKKKKNSIMKTFLLLKKMHSL